jgi:hypothetical protein
MKVSDVQAGFKVKVHTQLSTIQMVSTCLLDKGCSLYAEYIIPACCMGKMGYPGILTNAARNPSNLPREPVVICSANAPF